MSHCQDEASQSYLLPKATSHPVLPLQLALSLSLRLSLLALLGLPCLWLCLREVKVWMRGLWSWGSL